MSDSDESVVNETELTEMEEKLIREAIELSLQEETKSSIESCTLRVNLDRGFHLSVSDIAVTRVPGDGNCLYHALALAANEHGASPPIGSNSDQGWTHLSMRVLLTTYMNRCMDSKPWQEVIALTYEYLDNQTRPLYERECTLEGYGELRSTIAFACYFGLTIYVICEALPSVFIKNCTAYGTELTCTAPKHAVQFNQDVFIRFSDVASGHYDYISTIDETQAERMNKIAKMIQPVPS
ncbi:hypothetical protein CYMTET_42043 [Cymbomonas tetramitiformis]|uniref:OTU domain-containing protein n=1 Tax=Cymbomonas tetramitiformis TaxID=36881 RepID=A0AAE0C4Y0_9CHLO|nr:hypothetical protein CYMTET_42048 [Cymbomonas tetramitiformis]KAK3248492.1 hypothetical protein CYMTET_42043 [Cymbomonas tetramitiformis]